MGWRRHKKVIDAVKGFRGRAKNCYTVAVNRYEKSLQHAYKHRRIKKRTARTTWIAQVNAASRQHGVRYSSLIAGLKRCNIVLDRRILAELAITEPYSFKAVVEVAKRDAGDAMVTPPPPQPVEAGDFGFERRLP